MTNVKRDYWCPMEDIERAASRLKCRPAVCPRSSNDLIGEALTIVSPLGLEIGPARHPSMG